MKYDFLAKALEQISDRHIAEAAETRHRMPRSAWVGLVAAMLAVVILVSTLTHPALPAAPSMDTPAADTPAADMPAADISSAELPVFEGLAQLNDQFTLSPAYPKMTKFDGYDWGLYFQGRQEQYDQPEGYASNSATFFRSSITHLLKEETDNQVYSPLNIYMALAMLAEVTDGNTRQQIIQLLGATDLEQLSTQAAHMWNAHYCDDGLSTSVLGSSLWLDETYAYNQETAKRLVNNYYASFFQGDLGDTASNDLLHQWINTHTGGLLQEQAENFNLSQESVLALVSTIYYKTSWLDPFPKDGNTEQLFHASTGDMTTTFMHQELTNTAYYWESDCSAVGLDLKDGGTMWLVLPNEGYTPADLVASGFALDLIFGDTENWENQSHPLIRLSMPKFDVSWEADLIPQLNTLGITDVFDSASADFTALIPEGEGAPYVDQVYHAARVVVDEEGITGAAFTAMDAPAASEPLYEDEIDFILDRPFLFIVESKDNIPVFCGIVNQP